MQGVRGRKDQDEDEAVEAEAGNEALTRQLHTKVAGKREADDF